MARIGYALIGVTLVSGFFSFWREYRIEQTLNALQKLLPPQVSVFRGGSAVRASVEQLVPGDIILIAQGDVVPADRRLIEAFRCSRPNIGLDDSDQITRCGARTDLSPQLHLSPYSRVVRRRRALVITRTELIAIAPLAIIGFKRMPVRDTGCPRQSARHER